MTHKWKPDPAEWLVDAIALVCTACGASVTVSGVGDSPSTAVRDLLLYQGRKADAQYPCTEER